MPDTIRKMNQGSVNPRYPKKEKVLTVVGAFFVTPETVSALDRNRCPFCQEYAHDGRRQQMSSVLTQKMKSEINKGFIGRRSSCILHQSDDAKGRCQNVPFGGNNPNPRYNSTDNGPEHSARTHGGTTPFRGEKMTTYEGGVRVPMMVMWKDKIKGGKTLQGIQAHMDIFTTLAAAAGVPDVAEKLEKERKQPIDGVNNLEYWLGNTDKSNRNNFIYYHESDIRAVRINQWKMHFQTSEDYYAPYVKQKFPIMYNIHFDPYESFDNITDRSDILQRKQFINEPMQELLTEHIESLVKYPPVQKAASFDFSEIIKQLQQGKQ